MKPKRLLVPTDLSEGSLKALRQAVMFAQENEGEVLILHVKSELRNFAFYPDRASGIIPQNCAWTVDRIIREASLDLNRFVEKHFDEKKLTVRMRKYVGLGDVARRILELSVKESPDLIVMAPRKTRRSSFLEGLFSKSVVERVTREANCSVLCLNSVKIQRRPWGKPLTIQRLLPRRATA